MAVIDTLKLARALRDKGGFAEEAAEATAEAINDALGPQMASKADLEQAVERLEHRMDRLSGDLRGELKSGIRVLQWQVAVVWALQLATVLPGAWLLLKVAAKVGALG